MKPHEILGMIEEAAGTRMFENKKQAALKTIEKKSAKVRLRKLVLGRKWVWGGEQEGGWRTDWPVLFLPLSLQMSEIQKMLANEITPTLERLRSEKKHYLKWSANNTEIEKLQRLCVAYQYSRAAEEVDKSADELKQMEDERERSVRK